jgi:hypothetical protein
MSQSATTNDTSEAGTVCVANIGREERRKRLVIATVILAFGAIVGAALVLADVALMWRLLAFVPFWAGGVSIFQVREKTCVALAARGVRNLDRGEEAITDPNELAQVRRQARRVRLEGLALAVVLTLVLLALP